MAEAKNIGVHAVSVPDGRLVPPGRTVEDVDPADPEVRALVEAGHLLLLDTPEVTGTSVESILGWVGDDPGRAGKALAAERARPDGERRSTLVDRLQRLVDHPDTSQEDPAS